MQPLSAENGVRPLFSLVTAVYNVRRFLPDFLGSLDAQTLPHDRFELVAVDDGSTDGSLEEIQAWAERTDIAVTVMSQPNAGQASARNRAMEQLRGEWITFPDPDDVLVPHYLALVAQRLVEHPEVDLVACPFRILDDATGEISDSHPLRYRFRGRAQVRDLDEKPGFFFVNPAAGFYPRRRLEDLSLRFDERVRPSFEDGHFGARYLLATRGPRILFVPRAHYHYRKRADATSTLSGSLADPRRYTDVFRYGYLDLLQRAAAQGGIPGWLHGLILYDLSWLLRGSTREIAENKTQLLAVAAEFHDLMTQISRLLDAEIPSRVANPRMQRVWRDVVAHGWSGERWNSGVITVGRVDRVQGLARLSYQYCGERPEECFTTGSARVLPAYTTERAFRMLGRTLLHERVVWVPIREGMRCQLDDVPVPVSFVGAKEAYEELSSLRLLSHPRRVAEPPVLRRGDPRRRLRALANTPVVRRRFSRAWVLMDRIHDADDSGERLFEHLRAERPDLNAWFVVERGTEAWQSLRARYGRRVVAHGSLTWKLLMHHAEHLIASHADASVMRPTALVAGEEPVPWRSTFLQHGVIKDDLSSWLNPKALDVFVTSTQAEYDSIVGPDTAYLYTEREVVLTGLPRFDRLLRLGGETPPEERDLLLVCPTWRNWLTKPLEVDSQRRVVSGEFLESQFARNWLELLCSEALAREAAVRGLRVVLLPHPNLQGHLDGLDLPEHVELMGFDGLDAQRVFARCALMVTDYSSMAFNAAYLDRPVVYYQFDRERMFGGDHIGVGGYFDYERDGFGPVTVGLAETVAALADLLGGEAARERFAQRVSSAFPVRDGRCCERVVAAIEASTGRVEPQLLQA